MSYCLSGWEKYALDEKGEEYLKESFYFPLGTKCRNLYVEEKGEWFTICDKSDGEKIDLAKIHLEEGEFVIVISEHY